MSDPRAARIASAVERWFRHGHRALPWRKTYDPYHVWVSEVMAQQTRLEVVVKYFDRFIEQFPDISTLAEASSDAVAAQWSGLGYYRRARMLHAGASVVMSRFRGRLPEDVVALRTIPGIGRYTAGAIASIAFGHRAPAVDGNVTRVVSRLQASDADPWKPATAFIEACRSPRQFNQGLMEIGALLCKPRNPDCRACPLRADCMAFANDRIHEFPSRPDRATPTDLRVELLVVRDDSGRVLLRREDGPLMKSLFHLPHGDNSIFAGLPLDVARGAHIGSFRHTITSRRIQFDVIAAGLTPGSIPRSVANASAFPARKGDRIRDSGDEYLWVAIEDLEGIPHPSYVTKALGLTRNRPSANSR